MKAAIGEVNLTVIAVIAIAAVAVFGGAIIGSLLNNTGKEICDSQGGIWTEATSTTEGSCSTD